MQVEFAISEKQFIAESKDQVTKQIRLYAALGMYRTQRISLGAACEIAGVSHQTFLMFCKNENLPINTQTPLELENELKLLRSEET